MDNEEVDFSYDKNNGLIEFVLSDILSHSNIDRGEKNREGKGIGKGKESRSQYIEKRVVRGEGGKNSGRSSVSATALNPRHSQGALQERDIVIAFT